MNEEYKEFPCDLCEEKDSIEVPHCREYTEGQVLSICKNCGFIYAKKRRSIKSVADDWSNKLYGDPKVLSPSSYSARNPHVLARQTYVADFIDTHLGLKEKNLCDIGAGEGQFLELAKRYGANVFGIEPSENNCNLLQKNGFRNFNGTIEDYADNESRNENIDVITIMWTLEATQSCRSMLNVAHKILNDEGHITIATGSRIIVPFKKPLHTFLSPNPIDTHPVHFSFNTLKGMLAVSGFEVIHNNPYIENDILCVIAKKKNKDIKINWKGDDYLKVEDFFERWHRDSLQYR